MKCVAITVTYMVELQDRVLVPWDPLSISAVAKLVLIVISIGELVFFLSVILSVSVGYTAQDDLQL